MPLDIPSATIYAAIIGGSSAAVVGGFFNIWHSYQIRKSEERRHMRELAVKIASENWKYIYDRNKDAWVDIDSLSVFIINAMSLVACVDGNLKTPDRIRAHLRKGFADADIAQELFEERKKQKMTPKPK